MKKSLPLLLPLALVAACDKIAPPAEPTLAPTPVATPRPLATPASVRVGTPATPKPGEWMFDKNRGNSLERKAY